MIPPVSALDVIFALNRITEGKIEHRRSSTRFCLVGLGRHFPPKYALSLAVERMRGRPLEPQEFSGGNETNTLLANLGFKIIECRCGGVATSTTTSTANTPPVASTIETRAIGRVIVDGRPLECDQPRAAESVLLEVLKCWPTHVRVKFLITPGGFVRTRRWPGTWSGNKSWQSRTSDVDGLIAAATEVLSRVVTNRVLAAASGKTDVLTIGVDLLADSGAHVELVAVFDIQTANIVHWTGKSYPTSGQEGSLVQVVDLDTHLLRIAGERVMVLGCHDLNMFSPRGRAAQDARGHRRRVCDAMAAKVRAFQPTVVLQHPHTTDTPNIWRMPWLSLKRTAPSVEAWASAIGYYNWGKRRRSSLARVLSLTRSEGQLTLDIKVRSAEFL